MNYVEYDEKMLQDFEYETTIQSKDGDILGVCELGKATIQLINEENNYSSFKNHWIQTPQGSFYIHDVQPVQERINIKLDCYDIKYKLDTPYDSSKHTFPCTLKEWRNSIFDDCEVQYDNADFPYSNMILNTEPYIGDNPSNRNVIALIAQAGLSIVITDSTDKFYFEWFNNTIHNVEDWLELTTEKQLSDAISIVVLGRGDVEDNVYYPEEKPTNPIEFRIDNNYILDPQGEEDTRYDLIETFYNRLNGFQYLVFNLRTQKIQNKLSIKLGQKVKFIDIWDNELVAPIMTKKIKWLSGDLNNSDNYEITLSSCAIKETSTEFKYASNVHNDLLKVERLANKVDGEIKDVVKKTTALEGEISGNKTLNDNAIQDLIQKLNGVPSKDELLTLTEEVKRIQTSNADITKIVETIQVNGVDKVATETGVTIDITGMTIDQTTALVKLLLNANGQMILDKSDGSVLLFAGYDSETGETIVKAKNMTVEKYFVVGNSRMEKYYNPILQKWGTGVFHVGGSN